MYPVAPTVPTVQYAGRQSMSSFFSTGYKPGPGPGPDLSPLGPSRGPTQAQAQAARDTRVTMLANDFAFQQAADSTHHPESAVLDAIAKLAPVLYNFADSGPV